MISVLLLLIFLLIMLFVYYYIFGKQILSPSFICTGMYMLSVFIMLFYCSKWKVDLAFVSIMAVVIGLVSMGIGEYMGTKLSIRIKSTGIAQKLMNDDKYFDEHGILVPTGRIVVCLFFIIATAVLYFIEIQKIAANSAYAQSVYGQVYSFLMQVRWAKTLEGAQVPYYVQQMYTCCGAMANVFAYIIVYNKANHVKKYNSPLMYLIVIVYVITSFMTTGRAEMLNFFVFIAFVWMILTAKREHWVSHSNMKMLVKIVAIIGAAILLFYLAGFLTEKSLNYSNFFDNFANYFSSSLYAFNEYMKDPASFGSDTSFFGIHTLSGIYSFFRTLGFDIPDSVVALEYIECGDYLTNIYTPLRRYIQDFGWLGMVIIMFLIGYFYKRLIRKNRTEDSNGLTVILSAYFMFPLVYIAIEERVFMDVIMMRSIYHIIYIVLIYQLVIKGKFFNKRLAHGI